MFSRTVLTLFSILAAAGGLMAGGFDAVGPVTETRLPREKFLGAVTVTFDLLPTTMSFDLPWHFCAVTENGIKLAHFAAETCDPRNWDGTGADASFEAGANCVLSQAPAGGRDGAHDRPGWSRRG